MDNQIKLSDELLKADGIDPENITETERVVFREMLDSEQKRMKRLSWLPIGVLWVFAIALLGLCAAENILEKLHFPFIVAGLVITAAMLFVTIRYTLPRNKMIMESNKKISKLHHLVHGRHRGIIMIGKKDGKRFIYWPRIILFTVTVWLAMSLGGAGVWYLLCQGWIYSSKTGSVHHIFYCTAISLSFVIFILREGLKTPLEELVEVKTQSEQSRPNLRLERWRIITTSKITKLTAAAFILLAAFVGINKIGVPVDMAGIALADVAEKMEEVNSAVFEKTTTIFFKDKTTKTISSLVYYAQDGIRKDTVQNEKIIKQVYVNLAQNKVVGLEHAYKIFAEIQLTKDDFEKLAPISPKHIIERFLSQGNYKRLGRKEIDGTSTVGFEFKDKIALLSMDKDKIKNIVTRLWVDVQSQLPIRIEIDGTINDSNVQMVMSNPTWNIDIETDFFTPDIPANYLSFEERGLVGINLTNWPTLKVVPGMAAEKAGVKDGDIVIQVNGMNISHITSQTDALDLFFGKAGETVTLTVKRGEQIETFDIVREPLPK